MEIKKYVKPNAEYILFYSDEELTISLEEGTESEGGDGTVGGDGMSTTEGTKPVDPDLGWEMD